MRFAMKEKFWSFGDQFQIRNENEQVMFEVQGKVFSWGDKLRIVDGTGSEVAYIQQKLLTWMPRYEIYRDGQLFAEVVKEWSWFKKKFTLDVPGPNDYTVTGSFWDHEFQFERGGRIVAQASKAYFSWSDTYGIDIEEGENVVSILATCVVIDLILDDEQRN